MATTRRMTVQESERKLKCTLEELKRSKSLCDQLLQEREDGEAEMVKIISKTKELKNELSELHMQYVDVCRERDDFKDQLTAVAQCSEFYVQALDNIKVLELQLNEANNEILHLKEESERYKNDKSLSLYDELVEKDITSHSINSKNNVNAISDSKFSVRKYLKLVKLIKKNRNILKNNFYKSRIITLKSECNRLLYEDKLNYEYICDIQQKYDSESQLLKAEINSLHRSLVDITEKYSSSQNELCQQIKNIDQILELSRYNEERFNSLTNKTCCSCQDTSLVSTTLKEPIPLVESNTRNYCDNTMVFSDEIGAGLGQYFNNRLNHDVVNYCMPGNNFNNIVRSIANKNFNPKSNIIIFVGSGLNIKKNDLYNCINILADLKVRNITVSAFPYSNNFSEKQNKYLHGLNNLLYNMTHNNPLFSFFDINIFLKNSKMTQDISRLPKKVLFNIATLVANNILFSISNDSASTISCTNVVAVEPYLNF